LIAKGSEANVELVNVLAKVKLESYFQKVPEGIQLRSEVGFDVYVEYEAKIDVAAERERLTRDITKYEKGLAAAESKLRNEVFLAKAQAQVIEGVKKQEAETRLLLDKARAALAALPEEN
jgi:valyl-tRNA synthetase